MSTGPSAEELRVQLVSEEKYLDDRIAHVERNFAALALELGGIARKTARLRDKGDRIVKTLQDFSSTEAGATRRSLDGLSECFSSLENCQQLKIDKMEAKVVQPLMEYEGVCRKAKGEIKTYHAVTDREVNKQRHLDRVRIRDPANRKRISEFESDLQKVRIERLRASKSLEDYMAAFERKRIQDLKEILGEFIHAQMTFHAKALELHTLAHQHVQDMSEEETQELFHKGLHSRKQGSDPTGRSRSTSNSPMHTGPTEPLAPPTTS